MYRDTSGIRIKTISNLMRKTKHKKTKDNPAAENKTKTHQKDKPQALTKSKHLKKTTKILK